YSFCIASTTCDHLPKMPQRLDHLTSDELQQHGTALRALGKSLLAHAADDLLQDGWVAALQSPPPRHLRAWLTGTLRRLAAARRRGDLRRQQREREAARPGVAPSAADTAAAAEVVHRIAAAVAQLHEPYRSAVVLRFWHGLEPRQLGERLGIPANTARSRVQRGLELLRARLSSDCGGQAAWAAPLSAVLAKAPSLATPAIPISTVLLAMKTKLLLAATVLLLALSAWLLIATEAVPAHEQTRVAADLVVANAAAPTAAPGTSARTDLEREALPEPGRTRLHVSVTDEHDTAMARVPVFAYGRNQQTGEATTDDEGRAVLRLPPGEHFVSADCGARPERPDLHCNGVVVRTDGLTTDLHLVMERFCCFVQVRVVDDLGQPVEGIVVRRDLNTGGSTPTQLATGADGIAAFAGLPPGTSGLRLDDRSPPPRCGVAITSRPQSYTVGRDGTALVEFRLDRLGTVHLRLRGVEPAEASMFVTFRSERYSWNDCWGKQTQGGELTLAMPPGDCELLVQVPADVPALFRDTLHFSLAAGEDRQVDVPLEPAPGVLTVHVIDEHGAAVAGAAATAISYGSKQRWAKTGWLALSKGDYVLRGIPNEPLRLVVEGRGVEHRNLAFLDGSDDAPYLELSGPQSVTVVLREAYAIRGRVLAADGQAIVDGQVCRGRAAGVPSDRVHIGRDTRGLSAEPGVFEFRWLRPGRYPLWLGDREDGPPDAEVELGPNITPSHVAEVVLHQQPVATPK
ncbi:MAG TPA: sigma-70 family RNA polymerase sigma factor, partial [Planctomycetota bacterium]|nr:sigma-70 family RNA polymerase sigma factor [Planctomycetota bacterium]